MSLDNRPPPACCLWMTHLSSLSNPTACLRSPMKIGKVTHIRDATFSSIKRFAFELPTADKKFELTVLTSKYQCYRAKNPNLPAERSSVQVQHLLAQQHLLSCSGRRGDCKAPFASHFEIRAMTQFITFGKQLQLQLEDPDEEGRKTSSVTAGYYQREGRVAVSEGRSSILKKPQNEHGW